MPVLRFAYSLPLLALLGATPPVDPLRFFEGRTVAETSLKIVMKKAIATRTVGQGTIEPDGSLRLTQMGFHDGKPEKERRWHVRRTGDGHFRATMSDAAGPVAIERIGDAYRFRFRMKGHLKVEQWVKPLAGGRTAKSSMKVRKFGLLVASSEGVIRKVG